MIGEVASAAVVAAKCVSNPAADDGPKVVSRNFNSQGVRLHDQQGNQLRMSSSRWAGAEFFQPLRAQVGANIAAARDARGLARKDLAEAVGLGYAALSRIETGGGFPSVEALYAISQALRVHPGRLLTVDRDHLRTLDMLFAATDELKKELHSE